MLPIHSTALRQVDTLVWEIAVGPRAISVRKGDPANQFVVEEPLSNGKTRALMCYRQFRRV